MKIVSAILAALVRGEDEELDREAKQYYRNQGYNSYNQQYYPGRNINRRPIQNFPNYGNQYPYQPYPPRYNSYPPYPRNPQPPPFANPHPGWRHYNNRNNLNQEAYSHYDDFTGYQSYPYHQNVAQNTRPDSSAVRLARPGENAIRAGRKVRPPGERDERLVNPRLQYIEDQYAPQEEYDDSSYYEASYASSYELSENEMEGSSQEKEDALDVIPLEDLKTLCGPEGSATSHEECQENRPDHPENPDLIGLPDLMTNAKRVQETLHLDYADLSNLACALEEGCFSKSAYRKTPKMARKLLKFTQMISNIGDADFLSPHNSSDWEYHTCHKHYHSMSTFSEYSLLTTNMKDRVAHSQKVSFCLEDSECKPGVSQKYHCLQEQAISPGCSDVYVSGVDCQWIDVTDVRPGSYVLVIEVNPNRLVKESNFINNRMECDLFLQRSSAKASNCRTLT
ncbi:Oidioi.mRNA.OKI2018_I69.chr2.g5061.t1.cds [Oikopleura dioica]|uniref:Oidioi.mRNA.OKI2018_I69.chr2.g5061.t1.cds n=1 Tax=Oikopleura dioica TaxID=34765 RepID=A0ABN7SZ78_OIKDI|nr:Oidioi.mRNA.OKI2018_I69.chr2.g5061.t1.cds [Oikopleura dioica]